jgi:hypothetical protein
MFDRAWLRMRGGYLGIMLDLVRRPLGKNSIQSSISAFEQDGFWRPTFGWADTNLSLFLPCYKWTHCLPTWRFPGSMSLFWPCQNHPRGYGCSKKSGEKPTKKQNYMHVQMYIKCELNICGDGNLPSTKLKCVAVSIWLTFIQSGSPHQSVELRHVYSQDAELASHTWSCYIPLLLQWGSMHNIIKASNTSLCCKLI